MPGTKETREKQARAFLYLRKEKWLQEHPEMKYNKETYAYESVQLLKQGAYNYQYLYFVEQILFLYILDISVS